MSSEVSEVTLNDIIQKIRNLENFEIIDYKNDKILITKVKGIIKISSSDEEFKKSISELRKRKPRGKPTKNQLTTLEKIVEILIKNKIKFKVVFEAKEIVVRFDLDHYIRLTDKDVRIVGFKDVNDGTLSLISNVLSNYGTLIFLKPIR